MNFFAISIGFIAATKAHAGIELTGSDFYSKANTLDARTTEVIRPADTSMLPQALSVPSKPSISPPQSVPANSMSPSEPPPPATHADPPEPRAAEQPAPGDIVVTGRQSVPINDPLQAANVQSFKVTQKVDTAVMAPIALAYRDNIPDPIRTGARNFLKNLHEPVVMLNFVLQHKIGKAAETIARFGINSTIGLAGVIDVAAKRPFHLPRRPNGFADTFGFYGVGSGPFFYVPLIGPTTLRDFTGDMLDRLVLPISVGEVFKNPAFTVPATAIGVIDRRAEFDTKLHQLRDDRDDAYEASRRYYLERRQTEINELRRPHHKKKLRPSTD